MSQLFLSNFANLYQLSSDLLKCCQILTKCGQDPETNGLKRLLAVKKSLSEFEQRVEHVRKVNRARLKFDWLHI